MNKLLIFPLAIMFMITIFSAIYGNNLQTSSGNVTVNGSSVDIAIPSGGSQHFNIWSGPTAALTVLMAAMVLGGIAGIHFLGSGLSDFSQRLIFNAIAFLGLWACLTVFISFIVFSSTVFSIFWMILTVIFVIGFVVHMSQGE